MKQGIYQSSGITGTQEMKEIYRQVLSTQEEKSVLMLDLALSPVMLHRKAKNILIRGLSNAGVQSVNFLTKSTDKNDFDMLFRTNNFLYIPGGHPLALIKKINEMKLGERIREFEGVIFGNEAGATMLSPYYLEFRKEGFKEPHETLGLVENIIKTSYEASFDEELLKVAPLREIYGMEEGSMIHTKDGNKVAMKGNIWLFKNGKKEKVN